MLPKESHPYQMVIADASFIHLSWLLLTTGAKIYITPKNLCWYLVQSNTD